MTKVVGPTGQQLSNCSRGPQLSTGSSNGAVCVGARWLCCCTCLDTASTMHMEVAECMRTRLQCRDRPSKTPKESVISSPHSLAAWGKQQQLAGLPWRDSCFSFVVVVLPQGSLGVTWLEYQVFTIIRKWKCSGDWRMCLRWIQKSLRVVPRCQKRTSLCAQCGLWTSKYGRRPLENAWLCVWVTQWWPHRGAVGLSHLRWVPWFSSLEMVTGQRKRGR